MAPKKLKFHYPLITTVLDVFTRLKKEYPDAKTELTYESPFQLLVAVILSAQCTDQRVNLTTPALFKRFPTPKALAKATQSEVETLVKSCGFYRMKAKAIIKTAKDLTEHFNGNVPGTLEELVTLSGVGRKTASVVLNQAFDVPAIAVDTHVKRVSHRLGWSHTSDAVKIEHELRDLIPIQHWSEVNGLLILHGRRICKARKPLCLECPVNHACVFFKTEFKASDRSRSKDRNLRLDS
jgi:endonuclease III